MLQIVPISIQKGLKKKRNLNSDIFYKTKDFFSGWRTQAVKKLVFKKYNFHFRECLKGRLVSIQKYHKKDFRGRRGEKKGKKEWAVKKSFYDTLGNTLANRCLSNQTAAIY